MQLIPPLSARLFQRAFSEEEETKLLTVFNLTQPQLTTLIEASTYIFEQATYFTVSANKLVNQLMAASVADAQVFVHAPIALFP